MVEVQVGVDHNVDFSGIDAGGSEVLQQLGFVLVNELHLFRELGPNAGFDQDSGGRRCESEASSSPGGCDSGRLHESSSPTAV